MADGLTVPFALAAGLSGAVGSTGIIVTAGLAEVAAGSIAMGLGGYLAARSDAEHYASERKREQTEIATVPEVEMAEVAEVFHAYGLTDDEIAPILRSLRSRPEAWTDFMMRFELGLEAPDPSRALKSALTIAGAYIIGGFIPPLRAGPRGTRSESRPEECLDDRRGLHHRRIHPAGTLFRLRNHAACPDLFHRCYSGRAPGLWLHQGPIHRTQAHPQRTPDHPDRRSGRSSGVRHRESHFIKPAYRSSWWNESRNQTAILGSRITRFTRIMFVCIL
jgi:hypothetical protein